MKTSFTSALRIQRAIAASACALSMMLAPDASAGRQDFTLHNETGLEIRELYVSATTTDEWEEDVLGDQTLSPGESFRLTFDSSHRANFWDIKVVFSNGKSNFWRKLKLTEITDVTISFRNGKPWATWRNG